MSCYHLIHHGSVLLNKYKNIITFNKMANDIGIWILRHLPNTLKANPYTCKDGGWPKQVSEMFWASNINN